MSGLSCMRRTLSPAVGRVGSPAVALSEDQKAMLRLQAQREEGYDDIAALTGGSVEEVRAKVKGALAELDAASPSQPRPDAGSGEAKVDVGAGEVAGASAPTSPQPPPEPPTRQAPEPRPAGATRAKAERAGGRPAAAKPG